MGSYQRQGDFFLGKNYSFSSPDYQKELLIKKKTIESWQLKITQHQESLFNGLWEQNEQISLFNTLSTQSIKRINPLKLTPVPLNFWKWPDAPHQGPAIYLVMDKVEKSKKPIILYIGETIAADKRWKGIHDCKIYLENYSESLQRAKLKSQLNIRFWIDAPQDTLERRNLEQQLIQAWLPPFNKETRSRWATPFTSQISQ